MNNLMEAGTKGVRKEDELEEIAAEERAMARRRQQQAIGQVLAGLSITAQRNRARPISERHTWTKESA